MSNDYQAYLVRFERNRTEVHWRGYLENAETGETSRFSTELELLRFLLKALAATSNTSADRNTYTSSISFTSQSTNGEA